MIEAPWLKACKKLPVGATARFRCCGRDAAGVLYNNPDAWEYYCHRCKHAGKERKQFVQQAVSLPEPRVQPAPADLKRVDDVSAVTQSQIYAFLATKGIMPEMIGDALWSDSAKRLVFPVSSGLYLGRAMTSHQSPKWIQYGGKSAFAYIAPKKQSVQGIILTEDFLSAKKVQHILNRYGAGDMAVIALLGTRLDKKLKMWIAENNFPVLLMLDGDEAGYAGTARIRRELRPFVKTSTFAVEGKDPKDMQAQEILDGIELHRPRS